MFNPFDKEIRKVYGPYERLDKRRNEIRRQIVIKFEDGTTSSMSYARWLMTQHLQRRLLPSEEVDHIDKNQLNDSIESYQILDGTSHRDLDTKRVQLIEIICVRCGKPALKSARYLESNAKQHKAGPFCSKSCAGKYGAAVQNGQEDRLAPQPGGYDRVYYNKKNI